MEKKKLLFIIGVVVIVILGIIAIGLGRQKKKNDENNANTNDVVLKDNEIGNLTITSQALITRDNLTTYYAKVTNNLNDNYQIDSLEIIFTVADEEIKAIMVPEYTFNANETYALTTDFDRDVSKASKVEYQLIKDGEVVK